MFEVLSHITKTCPNALDLVVHIGCGALVSPSDYAPLNPARLVLVEADTAAASRLRSTFMGSAIQTQVFEKLLLPKSGPASLLQFNLSAVNGIHPAGELIPTLYPSLRLLKEFPLESEAFCSFLASLPLDEDRPRLLILDVPGQELALLESLSEGLLARFEWILLRGGASAWLEHSNLLETATSFLESRAYESVATDFESDPAWPLQLLRLNTRHAALQAELDSRARLLIEKATEIYQQTQQLATAAEQLAQAQAQIHSLESALDSHKPLLEALTKGRAQQDQLYAELAGERAALQESLANAHLRIEECEAQLAAKDATAHLLDTEFQKVEGQMELIRGLVFRDHGR